MLTPPSEVVHLLQMLGYEWPEADETKLMQAGQQWMEFSGKVQGVLSQSEQAAQQVWSGNTGEDIDTFRTEWSDEDAPVAVMRDGAQAAIAVGAAFFLAAMVVLTLKIIVIVQLVMLAVQIASALAAAGPTFGASLGWIPVAKTIAKVAIDIAISQAVGALLG